MSYLKEIVDCVITFMKIEFELWGFKMSLWSIFIWGILAGLVLWTIRKVFGGGD